MKMLLYAMNMCMRQAITDDVYLIVFVSLIWLILQWKQCIINEYKCQYDDDNCEQHDEDCNHYRNGPFGVWQQRSQLVLFFCYRLWLFVFCVFVQLHLILNAGH